MDKSDIDAQIARFAALPQCVPLANYNGNLTAGGRSAGAAVVHAQSGLVLVAVLAEADMKLPAVEPGGQSWGLSLGGHTLLTAAEIERLYVAWGGIPCARKMPAIDPQLVAAAYAAVVQRLEANATQLAPREMAELVAASYQALSSPNGETRLAAILKDI